MKRVATVRGAVSMGMVAAALGACAGPGVGLIDSLPEARLEDAMVVKSAAGGSAAQMGAIAILLLRPSNNPRPSASACPRVQTSGDTLTLEGGCTDADGTRREGTLTVQGPGFEADGLPRQGDFSSHSSGLHDTKEIRCTNGSSATQVADVSINVQATMRGTRLEFTLEYVTVGDAVNSATCTTTHTVHGQQYRGSIVFDPPGGTPSTSDGQTPQYRMTFEGSGRFGDTQFGRAEVSTVAEVYDPTVCSQEALSGTTTITAGGHTAVLSYDGAAMCMREQQLPWTLDGAAQTPLTGIQCTVGRAPGAGSLGRGAFALCAVGAALALCVARRRAR